MSPITCITGGMSIGEMVKLTSSGLWVKTFLQEETYSRQCDGCGDSDGYSPRASESSVSSSFTESTTVATARRCPKSSTIATAIRTEPTTVPESATVEHVCEPFCFSRELRAYAVMGGEEALRLRRKMSSYRWNFGTKTV